MKVYIVLFDYDGEGYCKPDAVFLSKEKAEAFRDELNEIAGTDGATVIEMSVADA